VVAYEQAYPDLIGKFASAANLKDLEPPMPRPGIKINTNPADYFPIEQVHVLMARTRA
jgi:hypothetical protein